MYTYECCGCRKWYTDLVCWRRMCVWVNWVLLVLYYWCCSVKCSGCLWWITQPLNHRGQISHVSSVERYPSLWLLHFKHEYHMPCVVHQINMTFQPQGSRMSNMLFTLMLLVANLANTKWSKKSEKWLAHGYSSEGTHRILLSQGP